MDFRDYKQLLQTELLTSLQIHIYNGLQMTFTNTILKQAAKLIPPNVSFSFVTHNSPIGAVGNLPFGILNQKHIKSKQQIYKLLITLLYLTQEGQPQEGIQAQSLPELTIILNSVLKQYEELSQVATVLNIDELNPYWLLLNPISKWKQGKILDDMKNEVKKSSNFFVNHELNSNYFLYRVNLLQEYVAQLKGEKMHKLSLYFLKICQIAFLKHLKINSSTLFEVVIQQPSLKQIDDQKLTILLQLIQIQQRNVDGGKVVQGMYGSFRLPGQKVPRKKEEEQYTTLKEKAIRALIKPVSVTAILLISMLVLKK